MKRQVGGAHYLDMGIQPWEVTDAWGTQDQRIGYYLFTAVAYLSRFNSSGVGKGGVVDVKKAKHVLEKLIETLEEKKNSCQK